MSLKSQDILIVLKLVTLGDRRWSYPSLAKDLFLSPSGVHEGVNRAIESALLDPMTKRPRKKALEEFLVHAVKYFFPPKRGGLTRGIPTGHAAPPLNLEIVQSSEVPVWPFAVGPVRGYEFTPLHKSVPWAAEKDIKLYELLALLDAIRGGRARESLIAIRELRARLGLRAARNVANAIGDMSEMK